MTNRQQFEGDEPRLGAPSQPLSSLPPPPPPPYKCSKRIWPTRGISLAAFILLGTAIATIALMMTIGGVPTPVIAQTTSYDCDTTTAIPDPEDPNLVHDCEILLTAASLLTDTTGLNWDTTTLIHNWVGITGTITISRVTGLDLANQNLTGTIPAALGNLTALQTLHLYSNSLTGTIPASLANLTRSLRSLRLHSNQLRGQITTALNVLTDTVFTISGNDAISGCIPPSLWGNITAEDKRDIPSGWRGCCAGSQAVRAVDPTEPLVYTSGTPHSDLVNDCNTMLTINTYAGWDRLNWDTSVDIRNWQGMMSNNYLNHVWGYNIPGISIEGNKRVLGLSIGSSTRDTLFSHVPGDIGSDVAAVPAALADLDALRVLYIRGVTGTIPLELANLTNLKSLNLSPNLRGTIPIALFAPGNFPNLQWLWISNNKLTGTIPPELTNLPRLETLQLNLNLLTGTIPYELGDRRWVSLGLHDDDITPTNNFSGCLPQEIRANDLTIFFVPRCAPSPCSGSVAIPGWSTKAPQEPPGLVADCNALVDAKNSLKGTLNWSTGGSTTPITDWVGIGLDDNDSPTQVITLDLSSRMPPLSGTISAALGNLTRTLTLNLSDNQLTGTIPSALGNLSTTLTTLNLSDNQLTGTIPSALGNLSTTLTTLNLYSNTLTGSIPDELGNIVTLETLNLARNNLTGTIPSALGQLSRTLTTLNLYGNSLTGGITQALGTLTGLVTLQLQGNQLSITLPADLEHLSSTLQTLRLGGNMINEGGCIPVRWGEIITDQMCPTPTPSPTLTPTPTPTPTPGCDNQAAVPGAIGSKDSGLVADCQILLRAKPTLQGSASLNWALTSSITDWEGISVDVGITRVITVALDGLLMSGNRLTGNIPRELSNLSALRELQLSDQLLTGTIPPALGTFTQLQRLEIFSNTQLTGQIPRSLGSIVTLQTLNLSDNSLTGPIPPDLGKLSNLLTLNLYSNTLSGKIPYQLQTLSRLVTLDLRHNQLTNAITSSSLQVALPGQLRNLSNTLENLYLENSGLTGCLVSELWGKNGLISDTHRMGLTDCGGAMVDVATATPTATPTPTNTHTTTPTHTATATTVSSGPSTGGGGGGGGGGGSSRPTCTNGIVVPNPTDNAALVRDCVLLLTNKATLEGRISTAIRLNWSEDSSMATWEGVTIGASPQRVTKLELQISGKTLAGSLPTTLSQLTGLQTLNLANNQLSGRLPVGLRALANLQVLDVSNNRLSGSLPTDLGSIANLQTLHLANNSLTGIIPTTLVDLANLRSLSLAGNRLSGCIPNALARVAQNDLGDIELPFCDPVPPTPTPTITATPAAPAGQDVYLPLVRQ